METSGYENRAYENIYMLAAVYKEQVILKQEFTFYNEAASRDSYSPLSFFILE